MGQVGVTNSMHALDETAMSKLEHPCASGLDPAGTKFEVCVAECLHFCLGSYFIWKALQSTGPANNPQLFESQCPCNIMHSRC